MTPLAQAMPDEYKHQDPIVAYRRYVINEKHYAKWDKGRLKPKWWNKDYAEALAMLDFNDDGLDAPKNALIDRLMSAPDLDAAALRHHLTSIGHEELMGQLFGTDMSARLGGLLDTMDAGEVNEARVRAVLDEMTERLARNSSRGG